MTKPVQMITSLAAAALLCSCALKTTGSLPADGTTDGPVCTGGEIACGEFCVDPLTDRLNCGGCGNECDALETCEAGECTCLEGYEKCGDTCVNVMIDRRHCGECDHQCDPLATCQSGRCVCPAGLTDCDGACVDTNTDSENCGGCGVVCTGGEFCNGSGHCALECEAPYTLCNPGGDAYCADLQNDPYNCSACGAACPERDHSVPECEGGACSISCDFGYGNANGDESDGCECTITSSTELCDAVDNDCNGSVDETFTCVLGTSEGCTLIASCEGQHRCVAPGCTWDECVNSAWVCTNPGVDTNTGDCDEMGDGRCGTHTRTCTDTCSWGAWGSCTLKTSSQCWDTQSEARDCDLRGSGSCGTQSRTCGQDCQWDDWSTCTLKGTSQCWQGDTDTQDCNGGCGTQSRTCGSSCQWGDWGTCTLKSGEHCFPGQTQGCTTSCGTSGQQTCNASCDWGTCVPPAETCNGADDDCDGTCDEPGCCRNSTGNCTTTCGSTGNRTCSSTCTWGPCNPPSETCNGVDDDCDGTCDEPGCCRNSTGSCTTSCGSTGSRTCSSTCAWGPCSPPSETCNGVDDDCDGTCDEPGCCRGTSENCTTSCGSTGSHTCDSSCAWGTCTPPAETCNGADDDCDGSIDEGFECSPGQEKCHTSGSQFQICNSSCEWGNPTDCSTLGETTCCDAGSFQVECCNSSCNGCIAVE